MNKQSISSFGQLKKVKYQEKDTVLLIWWIMFTFEWANLAEWWGWIEYQKSDEIIRKWRLNRWLKA